MTHRGPRRAVAGSQTEPSPLARGHRLRTAAAVALSLVALYGGSLPNDT
jgi:hypothetical protein